MKPGLDKCLEDEFKTKTLTKDSKCFVNFINPSTNLSMLFKKDKLDILVVGKFNN